MIRIILLCVGSMALGGCATGGPVEEPARSIATPAVVAPPLADVVMPYVYTLIAHDRHGEPVGQGSGFLWDQGYLVTNAHVVAGAAWVEVFTETGEARGSIPYALYVDVEQDLAVLPWLGQLTDGLPLASQRSRRGDTVFAFGAPMGLEGSMSNGIISAHRRLDEVDYLQTTAPISQGSSGGPLVDDKGQVVGIITAFFHGGQNLNLAVPATALAELEIDEAARLPFPANMPSSSTSATRPGEQDPDFDESLMVMLRLALAETLQPYQWLHGELDDDALEVFRMDLRRGEHITLEARSGDADMMLLVVEAASFDADVPWERIDDDGGRDTDARLDFRVPRDGTYYALVSTYDDQPGSYKIGYLARTARLDARWHWVTSDDEGLYFLDLRSIQGPVSARRAWLLVEYVDPRYTAADNKRYSSARMLWTFRCHQRSLSLNELNKLDNTRVVSRETVPALHAEWVNAAPDTIGEAILEEACR